MRVISGDCLEVLPTLGEASIDACVTDPPYHLVSIVNRFGAENAAAAKSNGATGVYRRASAGFMGKTWDGGDVAFRPETWAAVYRVLKPGAHLIAFGGTRTYHRLACAIEDAGFEIRDQIQWIYGSGFPKSHNIGNGFGTALKPAHEPIVLARKPLIGTVAANVLAHGTGALNIDGCRVDAPDGKGDWPVTARAKITTVLHDGFKEHSRTIQTIGRWPANVIHDGSEEVLAGFPDANNKTGGPSAKSIGGNGIYQGGGPIVPVGYEDFGSAARFFYTAKADAADRLKSKHPTVKPVDLMAYLVRLITPPGGMVLDPFAGSGTTGMACLREGFDCILIEREAEYVADIKRRIAHVSGLDAPLFEATA